MATKSKAVFGARLRELRDGKGLSPRELAERAGISREQITRLEADRDSPSWDTVCRLAEGLGVTPDAFLPKPIPERLVRDPRNRPEFVLQRIQAELMPEHQMDIVCINLMNGEWVLGKTLSEAEEKFRAKWPDYPYYFCRVDGGPACRL